MHCLCGGKKYKGIIDKNVLTLGHGAMVIASAQDTKDQGSNPTSLGENNFCVKLT
jgi:hypothetical protein